jgi:hypothetical protein
MTARLPTAAIDLNPFVDMMKDENDFIPILCCGVWKARLQREDEIYSTR